MNRASNQAYRTALGRGTELNHSQNKPNFILCTVISYGNASSRHPYYRYHLYIALYVHSPTHQADILPTIHVARASSGLSSPPCLSLLFT